MTAAKNVYALMLALVIVLSGCFGNVADDTDGQDSITEVNEPPLVHWKLNVYDRDVTTYNQTTGQEIETTYWNFTWVISATDFDGNVTAVGVDSTLDGEIDVPFTTNPNWSEMSVQIGPIDLTIEDMDWVEGEPEFGGFCFYKFNLIAIDDDGGKFIEPMIHTFGNNYWDCHESNN